MTGVTHDAASVEVVEDGRRDDHLLAAHHRVRQRERDEEGLEGAQRRARRHADARLLAGADGARHPLGDRVRHVAPQPQRPRLAATQTDTVQTHGRHADSLTPRRLTDASQTNGHLTDSRRTCRELTDSLMLHKLTGTSQTHGRFTDALQTHGGRPANSWTPHKLTNSYVFCKLERKWCDAVLI